MLLSIFGLAIVCLMAGPLAGQSIVISDVTVINPRTGLVTEHSNVVVTGTTVTAIQPSVAGIPSGTRRIRGTGKFLIPGLWDSHVHLTKTGPLSLPLFLANGVTSVRDMGSDFQEILQWRNDIGSGQRPGPRIFTSGPILESSANIARLKSEGTVEPVDRIRIGVANADEGRAAVMRLANLGVDHIKMRTTPDVATFLAVADEARRRNLPFAAHPLPNPQDTISSGVTSVEHYLAFPSLDPMTSTQRRTLFETMSRTEMFYSNTIANLDSLLMPYIEARRRIDDQKGSVDPLRPYVCGYLVEDWREQMEESKDIPLEEVARQIPAFYRDLREMREARVRFLAGTDAAVMLVYPGFSMHTELRKLVQDVGFTPMEALRAATTAPAAYFKQERKFGSIEPGQVADLVLLEADPLKDIRNTQRIAGVMANGKWWDRSALDRLMRDVSRDARSGCRPKSVR